MRTVACPAAAGRTTSRFGMTTKCQADAVSVSRETATVPAAKHTLSRVSLEVSSCRSTRDAAPVDPPIAWRAGSAVPVADGARFT